MSKQKVTRLQTADDYLSPIRAARVLALRLATLADQLNDSLDAFIPEVMGAL